MDELDKAKHARLKLWLDFWKVIFGTTVAGIVAAVLGFVIDWKGKELEEFNARTAFYNSHAQTIIEVEVSKRILWADFYRRFSPVAADRPLWESYWNDQKTIQARNPGLLSKNTNNIRRTTSALNQAESQVLTAQDQESLIIALEQRTELEKELAELTLTNDTLRAQLSGIRDDDTSIGTIYRAGLVGQPRGIRNNNPVLVDRSAWQGQMSPKEMTPIQAAETLYAVFVHPRWSYRAGAKVLLNSVRESELSITAFDLLFKWLSDNESYRRNVARDIERELGVEENAAVDVSDRDTMRTVLATLTTALNGSNPYPEFIDEGISMLPEYESELQTSGQ